MRNATLLIAALSFLPSLPSAAQSQPPAGETSGKRQAPMTLAGCLSPQPAGGNFTFTATDGTKYRLTGKNIKKYAGQEVEIVGGEGKKLAIKGGLLPSPNAAAQAGAIDPGQAAMMSQPGGAATGTGSVEVPVFKVNRVRGLGGSCQ
ncbi:MAG TPA: hypothetical protein VGL62_11430 [Vicinamibacterales bacterium]|jgi:hypothetical protein